jgi:hypothetical protein
VLSTIVQPWEERDDGSTECSDGDIVGVVIVSRLELGLNEVAKSGSDFDTGT